MKRYTKVKHGNEHVYRIEERNELYCNERMRSSQKKRYGTRILTRFTPETTRTGDFYG